MSPKEIAASLTGPERRALASLEKGAEVPVMDLITHLAGLGLNGLITDWGTITSKGRAVAAELEAK